MIKSKENYRIEECRHCGNKTKLDIVGKHTEYGEPENDYKWQEDWLMLHCCACKKISLASVYFGEDTIIRHFIDPDGYQDYEYEKIFSTKYPVETYSGINVSEKVNNAFSSALKAHYVDKVLCLIALRRTLELICKDKLAEGRNLKQKILYLTHKCIFPQIINEASDILRILGNEAAHGDDVDYDERIIKEMINFTQVIIEYVYIIPHRIETIKNKLTKTSSTKSTHQ